MDRISESIPGGFYRVNLTQDEFGYLFYIMQNQLPEAEPLRTLQASIVGKLWDCEYSSGNHGV